MKDSDTKSNTESPKSADKQATAPAAPSVKKSTAAKQGGEQASSKEEKSAAVTPAGRTRSSTPISSVPHGETPPPPRSSRPRLRPRARMSNKPSRGQSSRGSQGGPSNSRRRPDRNNSRRSDDRRNYHEELDEAPDVSGGGPPLSITELNKMPLNLLQKLAIEKELEGSRMSKQEIIFALLKKHAAERHPILGEGVVETLPDGFAFLRCPNNSYQAGPCDIYISQSQLRRYNLRTGDSVACSLRAPKDNERYFALGQITTINSEIPEKAKQVQPFEDLTPLFPDHMLKLEVGNGTTEDITARILDLASPIGKGQRGLIVSPPKAGKTMMMQNIAHSITANHPECELIVLLIDERPEEVTEMRRSVRGEVIASTFDEPATRHVQVAEIVIEKAKRLVEQQKDVVILLDSITRLARAYNTVAPSSGKILTGGVDANALQRPKRFFGAARNIEKGGSLTIIATALVETGSKMDEVIFEEFKGTGNMEAHLERAIAEKRVWPAINIRRSGTRREEMMMTPMDLKKRWIIRKVLHPMDEIAASEFLLDRLKRTKTNEDFFGEMKN